VTGQFESNGAKYTPYDREAMFKVLSELRAKGSLVSIDPQTGQRVDVDIAIERDCGPRS